MLRHDLYELCVQSPEDLAPFLAAVHGGNAEPTARVLGEDFAGTAALSDLWADRSAEHRAIAVDHDAQTLGIRGEHARVRRLATDVGAVDEPCDVLFVGNFSIGYWHTRAELVGYLRHARARLSAAPSGSGVFVCDTYGGESAFVTGEVHRDHWITASRGGSVPPGLRDRLGCRVRYTWEQREADPLTGMVTDVLHFRIVEPDGTITDELTDAFVYRWRLWSVPELRDAMADAGFGSTEVYAKTADAIDADGNAYVLPIRDAGEELEDSFIVCVAARV